MSTNRVEDAYRRNHPRLWHALLAYCGDTHTASEAESEVFAQAIRRGTAIRDVDAWLWRSAFTIANGMMHNTRQTTLREASAFDGIAAQTEDDATAEFVDQLADLSQQQRSIIILRYVGNFKPREIAELLNTSAGTVRVQLNRAHTALRHQLEETHGH